jgi:APA family basic amino acid/polyamine antiporter
MVFAMARRGDLPEGLAAVHPRSGAPLRAVLLVGVAAGCLAAWGTLRGIAAAASFAILVYYGIANLAALKMPRAAKRFPDAVPAVGLVSCAALAVSLAPGTMAAGVATLGAGFVVRAAVRWLGARGHGRGLAGRGGDG